MAFTPFLYFDGCAQQAMTFYADLFGASDLQIMHFADAPEGSNMGASKRVMFSQFSDGDHALGGWDFPEGMTATPQQSVAVGHEVETAAQGAALFDKLADGGEVSMAFNKTFFSDGFGMVKDRFGTNWVISVKRA